MVINVEILFVTEKHQTPGGLGRRTKHEAPRGVPDLTVRDLTALPRDVAASAEVTAHRRCGRCVATEAQLPRNRTARSVPWHEGMPKMAKYFTMTSGLSGKVDSTLTNPPPTVRNYDQKKTKIYSNTAYVVKFVLKI